MRFRSVVVVVLLLAGCSSKPAATPTTSTTTRVLAGPPVVLGSVIDESNSEGADNVGLRKGAEAAAAYINNDLGGLDGRPIRIEPCDSAADPATTTSCGTRFVTDKVTAVLGLSVDWGANGLPEIDKAGIPNLTVPISDAELNASVSFPIYGGTASELPGQARFFAQQKKIKKAAVLYVDVQEIQTAISFLLVNQLKRFGVTDVTLVPEQPAAADFTAAVTKANQGNPDVIFVIFGGSDCPRILKTFQQLGIPGSKFASASTCADPETVWKPAGAAAVGTYYSSGFLTYDDATDPDVKLYRDQLAKYGGGAAPSNLSQSGFATVMTFYDMAKKIGAAQVDAASLLAALQSVEGQKVFMGTELSTKNAPLILKHVKNSDIRILQWDGTHLIDAGGAWINGLAA